MAKTTESIRAGAELTKERAGAAIQQSVATGLGLAGVGFDVADTLVNTVVGVLDAVRVEVHRSTGSLIELSQTLATNAAKVAHAASDEINQATATILQTIAKAAHESISNTRSTATLVATTATDVVGAKPPVASA
jgi:hypothetical protein